MGLTSSDRRYEPYVLVELGGMLALETAAVSGLGDLVIVTCLLDVADPDVRATIVRAPWMARAGAYLSRFIAGRLLRVHLPLRWAAPMSTISHDPGLSAAVVRDPGADRWTPARLSTTYLSRLAGPTETVVLPGCGHFPVEEPGFQQLLDTVEAEFVRLTG